MEIRAIAPNEWKYTYSQSMQLEGQTGNIGHLRGDFGSGGNGFFTTLVCAISGIPRSKLAIMIIFFISQFILIL